MGNAFSLCSTPTVKARVFINGIDAAGKTQILYKLVLGDVQNVIPTIGFNQEIYKSSDMLEMTLIDAGGNERIWSLKKHYWHDLKGMIFVIDSNDRNRIDVVNRELKIMCEYPENKGIPLLILANKQDLPNAYSPNEIENIIEVDRQSREIHAVGCCGITGEGLEEGIKWLNDKILEGIKTF